MTILSIGVHGHGSRKISFPCCVAVAVFLHNRLERYRLSCPYANPGPLKPKTKIQSKFSRNCSGRKVNFQVPIKRPILYSSLSINVKGSCEPVPALVALQTVLMVNYQTYGGQVKSEFGYYGFSQCGQCADIPENRPNSFPSYRIYYRLFSYLFTSFANNTQ